MSNHAPVKEPKSKHNLHCLNLKLIAEGVFYAFFQTKGLLDDKMKVSCPTGVGNYLICMHCFETNLCGVTCARAV